MKESRGYVAISDLWEDYNRFYAFNEIIFVNEINLAYVVKLRNFEIACIFRKMEDNVDARMVVQWVLTSIWVSLGPGIAFYKRVMPVNKVLFANESIRHFLNERSAESDVGSLPSSGNWRLRLGIDIVEAK